MRRKEREIYDSVKINEIIERCQICRIGLNDNGHIYIIPMNFGFCLDDEKRVFYFHSTNEGKKIDLISRTHHAGFELDANYSLIESDNACNYSAEFDSVIGEGKIEFIEDIEHKKRALCEIMYHNTRRKYWDFPDAAVENVCIFKLEVETISCKSHHI